MKCSVRRVSLFGSAREIGLAIALAVCLPGLAEAAQPIADIQKARQACSDKAEKTARAYRVENNHVRVSSNYHTGLRRCFIYLETTTSLKSSEGAENASEMIHHQNWLLDAESKERLAMTMWNEPGSVKIGRIFETKYRGARDGFDVSDRFIRDRMALIAGL